MDGAGQNTGWVQLAESGIWIPMSRSCRTLTSELETVLICSKCRSNSSTGIVSSSTGTLSAWRRVYAAFTTSGTLSAWRRVCAAVITSLIFW